MKDFLLDTNKRISYQELEHTNIGRLSVKVADNVIIKHKVTRFYGPRCGAAVLVDGQI